MELLSALTSAPIVTGRACIPMERQRKNVRPATDLVGRDLRRWMHAWRPLLGPNSSPPSEVPTTSRARMSGGGGTVVLRRPRQPPRAVRARRLPVLRTFSMYITAQAETARRRRGPILVLTVK